MVTLEHDMLTVETVFDCRRIDAEMFIMLYDEVKKSLEFFSEKIEYHSNYIRTKPSMIEALIAFQKEEIVILKNELESLKKNMLEDCIMPSKEMPDFQDFLNLCDQIIEIDYLDSFSSNIKSKFNSLKKTLTETKNAFSSISLYGLFYHPSNMEGKLNALMEKYENEHLGRLKIYIDDFESAEAVKASLREEYKDCKAVKCWKDCAHDIDKTILAMFRAGCVEYDLLPLFEYMAKCKMLEWKFGWKKIESDMNESMSYLMNRNTLINIYNCPSINIGQAQDIISEGGIKNVYNRKEL